MKFLTKLFDLNDWVFWAYIIGAPFYLCEFAFGYLFYGVLGGLGIAVPGFLIMRSFMQGMFSNRNG
jgi:hypothetical protein